MARLVATELKRRSKSYNNNVVVECQRALQTPPNPVTYTDLGSFPKSDDYGFLEGFDTPNYHKRKRSGELLPHTPFTHFTTIGEATGYRSTITWPNKTWYRVLPEYLYHSGYWRISPEDIKAYAPAMNDSFIMDAAAKIYSNGFDALTFFAEFKESVRLFQKIGRSLLRAAVPKAGYYRVLSKRQKGKFATNFWLATRFGLRPLLGDFNSLVDAIKLLESKRSRFSEMAGTTTSQTIPETWDVDIYEGTCHYTMETTIKVAARGSVIADLEVPAVVVNPIRTAWELVPYSFVLDWFISVGKYLEALAFATRVEAYTASYGYRIDMRRQYSMYLEPGPNLKSGALYSSGMSEAVYEQRIPRAIRYFPFVRLRLNPLKVIDLTGLVTQLIL